MGAMGMWSGVPWKRLALTAAGAAGGGIYGAATDQDWATSLGMGAAGGAAGFAASFLIGKGIGAKNWGMEKGASAIAAGRETHLAEGLGARGKGAWQRVKRAANLNYRRAAFLADPSTPTEARDILTDALKDKTKDFFRYTRPGVGMMVGAGVGAAGGLYNGDLDFGDIAMGAAIGAGAGVLANRWGTAGKYFDEGVTRGISGYRDSKRIVRNIRAGKTTLKDELSGVGGALNNVGEKAAGYAGLSDFWQGNGKMADMVNKYAGRYSKRLEQATRRARKDTITRDILEWGSGALKNGNLGAYAQKGALIGGGYMAADFLNPFGFGSVFNDEENELRRARQRRLRNMGY